MERLEATGRRCPATYTTYKQQAQKVNLQLRLYRIALIADNFLFVVIGFIVGVCYEDAQ